MFVVGLEVTILEVPIARTHLRHAQANNVAISLNREFIGLDNVEKFNISSFVSSNRKKRKMFRVQ